jgi:hypothetical protein
MRARREGYHTAFVFNESAPDAEPVRSLYQCDQAGGSNRTDAGNLAQQFRGFMFPALGQKLGSQVSSQGLQAVQLLIEHLRATAHPDLRNLA